MKTSTYSMTAKLSGLALSLSLAACGAQMDKSLEKEINGESSSTSLSMDMSESLSSTSVSALAETPAVCYPEPGIIAPGTVSINGGAVSTESPVAVLELGGMEEILRMKISNDADCECGEWEFYSPTKQWTLQPVDGVATVGVQYKDYEGRVSRCAVATIRFEAPTTTTTTLPPTTTTTTLPPVVTTTTTLPPVITTTTTLPPVVTTTTTLPPVVTTTTTLPPVITTTTTLPPVVTTTTTLPPVVITTTTTTLPPVLDTTTTTTTVPPQPGHDVTQDHDVFGGNKKVDILIVDDNSGSMSYEQKSMANRMSTFLSQLKGLDWRVAITTTDPKHASLGDGRLLEMKGLSGQYYITSGMDHNMAQKILGDTIQRKETGNSSEQGIYVTYRAIERGLGIMDTASSQSCYSHCKKPSKYASAKEKQKYEECKRQVVKNPNAEFFRDDASLAVIIISDENESGRGFKNKPENLLKFVNQVWPKKLFNYHSIVTRTGDKVCLKGHGATYGTTYEFMSKLTGYGTEGGSIIGSVCEKDYGSQLSGISASCQKMQKVIQLKCAPLGNVNSSVRIQLNGSPYSGAYQVQGDRLVFTNYLPNGHYNLQYRCQ